MIQLDVLPDDVLLGIFDYYEDTVDPPYKRKTKIEAWQTLVHVCRRWRNLVFRSPRRLNLRLFCTTRTPVRHRLDIWPALPLIVSDFMTSLSGTDNIVAALGQSNRVCQIDFTAAGLRLDKVLAPMQVPFPELTDLQLSSFNRDKTVIPSTFLGGSAPRLQILTLTSVSFPGLPKLLLSTSHLVELYLRRIPDSGEISPEAIVPTLSMLSNLKSLTLNLDHFRPYSDRGNSSLPPPKRSILPALAQFRFDGLIDYLEQLVTRIDTPQLDKIHVNLLSRTEFNFSCPRLVQFINRMPTSRVLDEAHVEFHDSTARLGLRYRASSLDKLLINISSCAEHLQLLSIKQVCNPSLHLLSTVEDLYVEHRCCELDWKNDEIGNDIWLQLLLPFIAVKNLYLSKGIALGIAAALRELVGDRITEVLPNLQHIFMKELEPSGPFQENIGQFLAARQLSNHIIAVSVWGQDLKLPT